MYKFLREKGIPIGLLLLKVLTTLRTGLDTYAVSGDLLDVVLIDGAFAAFWMVAAYGGESKQALAVRPFAVAGAWSLYAVMLYIGWEAHTSSVVFAVRMAGMLALAFDTWDYLTQAIRAASKQRLGRRRDTAARQRELRRNAHMRVYGKQVKRMEKDRLPEAVLQQVKRDYEHDFQQHTEPAPVRTQPRRTPVLPGPDDMQHAPYTMQIDNGAWVWQCDVCGVASTDSKRASGLYANESGANKGRAGHVSGEAHKCMVASLDND